MLAGLGPLPFFFLFRYVANPACKPCLRRDEGITASLATDPWSAGRGTARGLGARPGVTSRGAGLMLAPAVSKSHWRIRFVCHLGLEFDVRMDQGMYQGPERSKARRVLPDTER